MKGRQRQKANRRRRLRLADGWSKDDVETCYQIELEAEGYVKPEISLGRDPVIKK